LRRRSRRAAFRQFLVLAIYRGPRHAVGALLAD
jgi:hypothetical protein